MICRDLSGPAPEQNVTIHAKVPNQRLGTVLCDECFFGLESGAWLGIDSPSRACSRLSPSRPAGCQPAHRTASNAWFVAHQETFFAAGDRFARHAQLILQAQSGYPAT
ncbi:hypothetical protein ACN47E_007180 [Coniothyrium glycines]